MKEFFKTNIKTNCKYRENIDWKIGDEKIRANSVLVGYKFKDEY
jgi:hypothetical protein